LAPKDGHAWLVLGETLLALNEIGRARGVLQKARTLTKGQLQDKAVPLLDQTLDALFTRDADGLRPEVVDGLVWALRVLAGMGDSKARQQLVLRAALLGQSGIDLLAPEPVHSLDGYAGGPLTGFQVGCLIHAGVQGLSPGSKTGLDWEAEYDRAVERSKVGLKFKERVELNSYPAEVAALIYSDDEMRRGFRSDIKNRSTGPG
jgi:hypothetical protein